MEVKTQEGGVARMSKMRDEGRKATVSHGQRAAPGLGHVVPSNNEGGGGGGRCSCWSQKVSGSTRGFTSARPSSPPRSSACRTRWRNWGGRPASWRSPSAPPSPSTPTCSFPKCSSTRPSPPPLPRCRRLRSRSETTLKNLQILAKLQFRVQFSELVMKIFHVRRSQVGILPCNCASNCGMLGQRCRLHRSWRGELEGAWSDMIFLKVYWKFFV